MKPLKQLIDWWNAATVAQRERLAARMNTSTTYLRSHAATGRREITAEYAARLEDAIAQSRVPVKVTRMDLCDTCRRCPHAREAA